MYLNVVMALCILLFFDNFSSSKKRKQNLQAYKAARTLATLYIPTGKKLNYTLKTAGSSNKDNEK